MIEKFEELMAGWFLGEIKSASVYELMVIWIQRSHSHYVLQQNLVNLFTDKTDASIELKQLDQLSELMDFSAATIIILNSEEKYKESQNIMDHLFNYYKDVALDNDEKVDNLLIQGFMDIMAHKKAQIKTIEGWDINEY
jgi:hypothetical protein